MEVEEKLIMIGRSYQQIIEGIHKSFPHGICYHAAASLNDYFSKLSIKASVVVGDLALINTSDKYVVYGTKMDFAKQIIVGDYHAWCEVDLEGITYIIDPSIKYNKIFLKNNFKFKTSKKVLDIIVTSDKETFNIKYRRNDQNITYYKYYLEKIPNGSLSIGSVSNNLIKLHQNI